MLATRHSVHPSYTTQLGAAYVGDSLQLLADLPDGSINLVVTSPPFALQRQKEYGNHDESEYVDWLMQFARLVHQKLREDGSFVLDLGGAYRKGVPVRSLYQFRVLLRFCDELGFHLAQEFFWHNPSKLPSPIEWVNKRKLRAKDTVNTVWWFSRSEGRRWLAFELNREYVAASVLRFVPKGLPIPGMRKLYERVLRGEPVAIEDEVGFQPQLLAM